MAKLPKGYAPTTRADVVARAERSRERGIYRRGGGAHFFADHCDDALGNRFPGRVDCTGLLAWCLEYKRTWENTDGIVADARGPMKRWRVVERDEAVLPGDVIVTGNGPHGADHACVIVEVLPGFVRLGPAWWTKLLVIHAAGASWGHVPREEVEDERGAVRRSNAYRWRNNGYIIRALHVTD